MNPCDILRKKRFGGELTDVKLRFHRKLLNVAVDRFGRDAMLIPEDEDHFNVTVKVAVSPMFLSWLLGFGNEVKILHPQSVVEEFKALCAQALEQY